MPKKDDTSVIPKSVLKQQADAEAKMKAAQEPDPDVPEPDNSEPIEPAADGPVVEPQHDGNNPDPTPAPAIPSSTEDSTWEHKYSVLQGKYNKEVSALRDELAELKLTIDRQGKVIEQQDSQQSANGPTPSVNLNDLDPEAFDGWGPEMVDMAKHVNAQNKIIKDQAALIEGFKSGSPASAAGQVDPELLSRVEGLENETRVSRNERYYNELDSMIKGDWQQINVSKAFGQWLDQEDPITMVPKRIILAKAAEDLRSKQVASIFNEYIKAMGGKPKVKVADELPAGGGRGSEDGTPRPKVSIHDLKKAEQDFIAKRITEDEYNKIANAFQTQARG